MGFEYKDSWLIHLGLSVLSSTLYTVIGLSIIYLLNFFLPGDFLGLFIDNKPFMNRVTPILDLKMSIHDLIIYVGFLIFFVYIISIYNTYFDYQQANMTIEAYQNELNKLVENN